MLKVSASPHITSSLTTQKIMLMVIIALLPSLITGVIMFGLHALILSLICIMSAVAFEGVSRIIMKREQTITDLSAALTGMLLAMNLPPNLPFWEGIIGSFIAVVIVKQLFGGLGQNFANPAIVARIVLMLSFTSDMTSWSATKYMDADAVTGATPLVSGNASYTDLLLGNTKGCIGEVCAAALILGGLFLIFTKIITPSAPFAFIGTVALLTLITGGDVPYQVLSGGLLLGAFFMATDYVTTPITEKGRIIFGVGCGIITFVIRQYGGYPEGVSFSILLMNIVTPYIDRFTAPKVIGALKEGK